MIRRSIRVLGLLAAVGMACSTFAQQTPGGAGQGGTPGGNQAQRPERGQRGGGGGGGGGMGGMFGGMFGGGGGRGVSVSKTDLDRIAKMVEMDKPQLEAAGLLHEAYSTEYEAYAQTVRDKMDDLRREAREAQDPAIWRDMATEMRKVQTKRQEMEAKFLTDLKDVLTPAQAEKWPAVERLRTRERTIGMGMMSGERLDVIRQVENLKLDDAKAKELAPVLDQYSVELDRELKARNTIYEGAQGQMQEIFASGDTAKATKMLEDARAAANKVREVNKRYARQIENLLPTEKQAAFVAAVKRESFPAIYRDGRSARAIERAAAFEDLSKEQSEAIKSIVETNTREVSAIRAQMERAYEQRETSIKAEDIIGMAMGGGGGGGGGGRGMGRGGMMGMFDSPEMDDLRTRSRDLEAASLDKIKALLNDEQKARLENRDDAEGDQPAPRQRNRGSGGAGGGQGGGQGGGAAPGGNGQRPARPGQDQRPPSQRS